MLLIIALLFIYIALRVYRTLTHLVLYLTLSVSLRGSRTEIIIPILQVNKLRLW